MRPVSSTAPLVRIEGLNIAIELGGGRLLPVVEGASFDIASGEMLGIIGESGSGKTMLCRSLIGTLGRRGGRITAGSVRLGALDLAQASEADWRAVRGRRIGYVPQSSLAGLNPVIPIEAQLAEAVMRGDPGLGRRATRTRALDLLERVRIRRPEIVLGQYSSQLSGGMRQRVMIACAIAARPDVLVADEPTTGLDVTVQADIMRLLASIRQEFGTAIVLISHDLSLVDDVCDRVIVMHAGACVEDLPPQRLSGGPRHPYTQALNRSRIERAEPRGALPAIPGQPPAVGAWPPGCRFADRCHHVQPDCRSGRHPALRDLGNGQRSACLNDAAVAGAP
jgi:oligopeptide/dipeptide ABC transporter ATP-binding protein